MRAVAGVEHGLGEALRAADLPHRDQVVEVVLLERRQSGEEHVRVTRGLVQRVVDADHAVEVVERGVETGRARRADHRVARDRDERPDLARARRVDLLGHARHRHLTEHLGDAAHARLPLPELHAVGERGVRAASSTPHAIGLPNISPPGRSKLPVRMFTTSTSHDVSVPNSWLHVPMRP